MRRAFVREQILLQSDALERPQPVAATAAGALMLDSVKPSLAG